MIRWVFALSVASCVLALAAAAQPTEETDPCAGRGTAIAIDTRRHQLYLCRDGAAVADYQVSIGKGGTPKRRLGDNKTPIGTYRLGTDRRSQTYKLFIPVGYPTAEQKRKGYTGKAIGIHGPKRKRAWAGALNTWFDWTQGCIAVGRDSEIEEIVAWARKQRPAFVHLY